jgi:hypothetical protein
MKARLAKFGIGQVVKHRVYPFRGVIYDVDPIFANTEEWWLSIPAEVRPSKDQPFYHLSPKIRKRSISPMSRSRTCFPTSPASRSAIPKSTRFSSAAPTALIECAPAIGRAERRSVKDRAGQDGRLEHLSMNARLARRPIASLERPAPALGFAVASQAVRVVLSLFPRVASAALAAAAPAPSDRQPGRRRRRRNPSWAR